MTQLTNNFNGFANQGFCNFNSAPHQQHSDEEMTYYVREPNGKRPFPVEFEMDMEYVPPRAKRRFDRISACLENFSISNDKPLPMNLESSSDEEMDEIVTPPSIDEDTETTSGPLVVEPDDEPAVAKKIRLDGTLQRYLDKYKQADIQFLPKPEKLRGDEIAIWQPKILVSPKNDFNMSGRIQEIDDDEADQLAEEVKTRIIENEGMVDEEQNNQEETTGIVDLNCASDLSDIGSSWSSPVSSPGSSGQIVELDSDSLNSLTNGYVTDEEMMEFE
ncbi:hypothetical protein CAEBREN_15346 [Caenorhabditis brenneri]|uniref:Uncharacterized protein n=1 Tax=Caenorhabditis brenneri TaxID=135651 RepID=G0NB06_CAEBE|nr:hypothetical protein CAEBREN_15346 [Caenorhabditis brenneri]